MRLPRTDEGIALAGVVLLTSIVGILLVAIFAATMGNYNNVQEDRSWERAIHVAEAGIDHALYLLEADATFSTGETLPAFGSLAEEEQWARDTAAAAVAGDPDREVVTAEGSWVTIKPLNDSSVYAVGYVPTISDPQHTRLVVVSYDFAPFSPITAVTTGGNLLISGSFNLIGAAGSAHANGDLLISGDPTTSGYISASGSWTATGSPNLGDPGNSTGGQPPVELPPVDSLEAYRWSEYDLCPDGQVYTGPAYSAGPEAPNTTSSPCAGTWLADAVANPYRNWQMTGSDPVDGAIWLYSGSTSYDGVYYVEAGSATISGSPGSATDPWEVTILASSTGSCGALVGGDIEVAGNPSMLSHSKADPLLLVAERDVQIAGNPSYSGSNPDKYYSGAILAGEQARVTGTPHVYGALLSVDECDTIGSPVTATEIAGDATIQFDGSMEVPIGGGIRITQWNEL